MGKKTDNPELNSLTDEDWEQLKSQEGIVVVDVYAKWAGPCTLMRPVILKVKAKLQISEEYEDIIQYATACSDSVTELECFKNICTPTFLFMAGGSLVAFMHGADGGKMREMIYEEVKTEMEVVAGQRERVSLAMEEAVPAQYEETEEEADIGTKTVKNMNMLKKSIMVGAMLTN